MPRWLRVLLLLVAAAALLTLLWRLDLGAYLDVASMRALVTSYGALGPLLFVGVCVGAVVLHLPEIVLIAIGGVLFGKLWGLLLGWVGSVLGAALIFLFVRHTARGAFQEKLATRSSRLQAFDERLATRGFRTVLVLRLLLFMAPPLNWLLGLSRVPFRHYLAGSALGVLPGAAITCYFADEISAAGSLEALLTPEILVSAALVLGFLVVAAIFGRRLLGGAPAT